MLKVLIFQRVAATFRRPFFELLAEKVELVVVAGFSNKSEAIKEFDELSSGLLVRTKIDNYLDCLWYDHNWKSYIETHKPDVVIITPTPKMLNNFSIINYCNQHGIKVIAWGMGEMPGRSFWQRKLHQVVQYSLIRKLTNIICYSSTARDYYNSFGVNNVTVANNSIDTNESMQNLKTLAGYDIYSDDLFSQFDFRRGLKRVIFVGRLIPSKKIDMLIETCDIEGLELVIVGDGKLDYVTELKKQSATIKANVVFVGYASGLTLSKLFVSSDVFVLPSLGGLAINHAMSHSLPIIASEGDGTERDLVIEGDNGFLFPSDNYQVLREHLTCILEKSDTEIKLMGNKSLNIIREKINISSMVDAFYSGILK